MLVLVACEESQRVCISFRELGHEAYSCDIRPSSGGHPEWHIQDDVLKYLNGFSSFYTEDGTYRCGKYSFYKWDLIIAHPPCTYLTNSQARWYDNDHPGRYYKRLDAIHFFYKIAFADCRKIAIENPVGIMSTLFRKPDQIYNPYNFGDETEAKKTCLWLKGLQPLRVDKDLTPDKITRNGFKAIFDGKQYTWNDPEVSVFRSKTPWAVARAMADQWGYLNV